MSALPDFFEILPMRESDIDEVTMLESQLQHFPWQRGNFVDSLESGHVCWVVRLGAQMIGFAVVMNVLEEAHLLNIGITKKLHGQGYGARVLRYLLDQLEGAGQQRMLLEVRPSNRRALDLYQHFGFRQIGLRKSYYPAVAGREDGLVLEWKVPSCV